MEKIRTVLVVEDQELNRALLEQILEEDCTVLQASNGAEALEIINLREDIAAIVLDLIMPVMDGFEFMSRLSDIPEKRNIPIIVATEHGAVENEKKALSLGAYDFVSKPYDPTVVRLRVGNAIEHSRLAAYETLQYLEQYDGLTGIYNKKSFIRATRSMLNDASDDEQFAIIRFDVTRFAMINAYYGIEEGDKLLKYIADVLRADHDKYEDMTYSRIGADDFCICVKFHDINHVYAGIERARQAISSYEISFNIILIFGVYVVTDRNQEIESMIANANMAAKRIKGNYLNTVAVYDEKLSKQRETEQEIVNEMKDALETEQFIVYLQPKYDSMSYLPCGAEALVRWKHPEKGMISPGVFIPVFESNGFVEPIDHYMWEHVCMLIRKWIDSGIDPNPVSVNVSRVNLYNPHIVEEIVDLTAKYSIPRHMLQLEITESAYTDNSDMILSVINKFHDHGFTVLMDDFGSGYSSLNVLKDMHVDVLKIDMKFFGKTDNIGRAKTIISSVVRMAKWLNIATVAEGVETKEQVEFLKSIGCTIIQGYYFAKPMPVEEYEQLVASGTKFISPDEINAPENFEWVNAPEIDDIFTSAMEPLCMSEVSDGEIEIIRVNQRYYDLLGYEEGIMFIKNPADRALDDYKQGIKDAYFRCASTGEDQEYVYYRRTATNEIVKLKAEIKRIKTDGNRCLAICYFNKISDIDSEEENQDELQIRRIIDMCEEKSKENEAKFAPYIPTNIHLPEMVNTILSSRYMDKHSLIIVSVDNEDELNHDFDENTRRIMWNSMECILNQHFRNNDMLALTGDHEYSIFVSSVPSEELVSVKCHELNRRLKLFALLAKFPVRVSIGVAVSSKEDRDFSNLYEMATEALHRSREHGHNRVYMVTNS